MFQMSATVPDLSSHGLSGKQLVQAWRDHAEEVANLELNKIGGRVPEDTATLFSSLTEEVNPNRQTIMSIYTDPEHQIMGPWARVYAQYQEGPPLGHTTYTRGEVRYVYRALDEDLGEISAWANRAAADAADNMVQSIGEVSI